MYIPTLVRSRRRGPAARQKPFIRNLKTFTRSEHFPKNHGSRWPRPPPEIPTEVYAAEPRRPRLKSRGAETARLDPPHAAWRSALRLLARARAQPTHLVYCSYVEVETPHRSRLVVLGCKREQRGQRGRQRGALSLDASARRSATRLRSRATRRRRASGHGPTVRRRFGGGAKRSGAPNS